MSTDADPVIGICGKCRKEILHSHPYVWCIQCGEPLSNGVNIKRREHRITGSISAADEDFKANPISSEAVNILRVSAWVIAIGNIICGIIVLMNTPEYRYATDLNNLRTLYLVTGWSQIVGGIIAAAFFHVIAGIAKAVLDLWNPHFKK